MLTKKFYFFILSILIFLTFLTVYKSSNSDYENVRLVFRNQYVGNDTHFQYVASAAKTLDNLPDIYYKNSGVVKSFNKSCAKFPSLFDLKYHNNYWQKQPTANGTFYLFNAYIDERNESLVRVITTYDVYRPKSYFWCQFWYRENQVKIVKSEIPYWMFREKWGADKGYFHHPYLITCPLVKDKNQYPVSVSLVENPCDNASNNLKLSYKKFESQKNFVVCVKGLSFPFDDKSERLAEWIELVQILGAEKINFYEFSVHPNTKKLLDYYTAQGLIEVTPLSIVGDFSNHQFLQNMFLRKKTIARRLQEVIPYNDCLYKHLQEFRYIVLLDTDEVIVPRNNTWIELIETLEKQFPKASSYVTRNIYFLDSHQHEHEWFEDIPKNMHMLQHVVRAKNYTKPGHFVKGFHNSSKVTSLHNHFPFSCFQSCLSKEIEINLAHLQHYRADCVSGVSNCKAMKQDSVLDTRVWNFKDELIRRVQKTLTDLDLLTN